MRKAIITGISGQDGSYLALLLLQKGYEVYGISRDILNFPDKNLRYLGIEKEVKVIELAQLDKEKVQKILSKIQPDELYNLSSQSSVGYSFQDPYDTLNYNILSVLFWLEGIRKISPGTRFYQASSSEMFGNVRSGDLPLKESLVFNPASPYGISKASAHWLAVNYRTANNVFAACGILFNHESPLRGPNFVVKKVINQAVKIAMGLQKDPLVLGNLNIQRDWGYAPDYVLAMWEILQLGEASDFLICSGNVMSLQELVGKVFDQLNINIEEYLRQDSMLLRPKELDIIYGDNTKAKSLLNWGYDRSNDDLIKTLIEDEHHFIQWEMNQK